jgi:hypothetical protein
MNIFSSALRYFAIVFGAGFLLALIRIPWLVPKFGVRIAELMEMPVMLIVIFFAARWIVRSHGVPLAPTTRLGMGLLALALLLLTEFTVVLWLQGLTIAQGIANRDPISGTAYAISLVLFAAMPLLVVRKTN